MTIPEPIWPEWLPACLLEQGDRVRLDDTERMVLGIDHRTGFVVHTVDLAAGRTMWQIDPMTPILVLHPAWTLGTVTQ